MQLLMAEVWSGGGEGCMSTQSERREKVKRGEDGGLLLQLESKREEIAELKTQQGQRYNKKIQYCV